MEPKFKTSFIPKQSLSRAEPQKKAPQREEGPGGLLTVIGVVALIIALGLGGVVFIYERALDSDLEDKLGQLRRTRQDFDPDLLTLMERLDIRIEAARSLLSDHIAPSSLYALIEALTLKSVQFKSLDYTYNSPTSVDIALTGTALNLESVAWQSDLLGNNELIRQPIISGLAGQGEEGNINFEVNAQIDPRFLLYEVSADPDDQRDTR